MNPFVERTSKADGSAKQENIRAIQSAGNNSCLIVSSLISNGNLIHLIYLYSHQAIIIYCILHYHLSTTINLCLYLLMTICIIIVIIIIIIKYNWQMNKLITNISSRLNILYCVYQLKLKLLLSIIHLILRMQFYKLKDYDYNI